MQFTDRRASARLRPVVLVAFVLVAAFARLLPHPPNLAPIGAIALFGGAYFASRRVAIGVTLAAMFLSDLALWAINGWGLGVMTPIIYACFVATVWFGARMRSGVDASRIAGSSLASAVLFFVVTNGAIWLGGTTYPRTLDGLGTCFVAALPFFGNTVLGYAMYGSLLFGGFELLRRRYPVLSLQPTASA